ncbi:baculoviral IAP repeat-containing protein 7 isoform X3 [Alosa sapidissima]|uniref:baculoviral IAP repeat-containing protein 7 isoform X3 n=1 Tax=Alosa sapidissima TaxID=34773 RepID=UPI001C09D70E|nr:baculoviral IAP repeat-containing protein 7 isoform X3 [Alosa sapidissima]
MATGHSVPHLDGPLWNVNGMTVTRSDGSLYASPNMTDDQSTDTADPGVEPGMRSEEERFRTFQNWPSNAPVTPADLARAGFYFLGVGDQVQCFCCEGILRYWVHGDSALEEHKRHFPTCDFVLNRNVGNIRRYPVPGSPDDVDGQLLSQLQRMTVDDQGVGGQSVYPEMESEDSRLTTYHNWPTGASVQPDALARAGFFYTGHGDNVKCFFCDGGLRNWEPGDDPWQEHAKWFPRCEFLVQTRGREYVSNIQESYFHMGETVGGSQPPTSRDITPGSDVVGGQGSSPALLSPVVQTVLGMGFQASLVESLVQTRYLLTGRHYTSVSDLVADILQAEEEDRLRGEQTTALGDLSAEEQLRQLQEERTCKVCMDKAVSIVFIPCGHLVVCTDCAASLRHCPICRAVIRGSVRAFMS